MSKKGHLELEVLLQEKGDSRRQKEPYCLRIIIGDRARQWNTPSNEKPACRL